MKHTLLQSLIILVLLSIGACGTQAPATPAVSAEGIQSTAIAAAFTIVAETQAAMPTNTAIPPTETPTQTPLPTFTLPATEVPNILPSLEATATLVTSTSGNGDPCNAPLKSGLLGRLTKIKLENNTGAPITVSLYLNLTPIGECGYRGYNLRKGDSLRITDLVQGCYNVSVFVNDEKKPTKSFGYGCINNTDQWTFAISRDSVILQGR